MPIAPIYQVGDKVEFGTYKGKEYWHYVEAPGMRLHTGVVEAVTPDPVSGEMNGWYRSVRDDKGKLWENVPFIAMRAVSG